MLQCAAGGDEKRSRLGVLDRRIHRGELVADRTFGQARTREAGVASAAGTAAEEVEDCHETDPGKNVCDEKPRLYKQRLQCRGELSRFDPIGRELRPTDIAGRRSGRCGRCGR